jgi:hypothetical protein
MKRAEVIFDKIAKVHPEHAGGTLAGGLVGASIGARDLKALEEINYFTKGKPLSKAFKARMMLPIVVAGGGAGYLIGQGLDKIFRKKGEFMKEAMSKAEYVLDKMEKNAINWGMIAGKLGKGLSKAQVKATPHVAKGKAVAKTYAHNVRRDYNVLKGLAKGTAVVPKGVSGRVVRNKALVGLAGRVGLPAYVAGDIIT